MEQVKNTVSLFPNPTFDKVNIHLDDAPTGFIQISIMNLNGVKFFSKEIDNQLNTINEDVDITPFSAGIYIVKIVTQTGNTTLLLSKI
jgi:Secretion system C-terminal sorting domain